MRWTRRRFVGASVGALCVGCAANEDAEDIRRSPSTADATESEPTSADGVPPPVFGGRVEVGTLDDVRAATATEPQYVPGARAWLVGLSADEALAVSSRGDERLQSGLDHGLLALYEKCPHLGCRVPFCDSSGWFECMCHGTQFNKAGEHRAGPGPRGLDALVVVVDGGTVAIIPDDVIEGARVGTVVVDQPAAGPHCVGEGGR